MLAVDLNWLLQFLVFPSAAALFGFIRLVRGAASRFSVVDSTFGSAGADFSPGSMVAADGGVTGVSDSCAVCGLVTTKHCSACKMVKYCSEACQSSHWNSEHKTECEGANSLLSIHALGKRKASLVPAGESSKILKQSNKILFPYEQFVQFFNWDELGHPPCGLINCGNSCFANVVLQCLAHTRPLVAYLLEKGHKGKCIDYIKTICLGEMDKWCFFCEFQSHVERANWSHTPFSPINILSRLPCIGSNLTCGEQEDAHEFMRYAINTMQSLCLDEFGGEKAIHPSYQETTLVQHIFGGRLQSQVMCTKCNNVTNQFENIMDLTVEIHGDVVSLEECLDKFTSEEWLHGDNMYKCDRCNDYVMAWKHLSVRQAPNILTITLKRFQGGEFGKLNKRVTFPEMLDLSPYMSELEEGNDLYKLYAVIVHLDLLNASFFGHYICYVRDFRGNWYMIDDSEVIRVGLGHVLSQRAYMLLYSRIRARPSCLLTAEDVELQTVDPSPTQPTEFPSSDQSRSDLVNSGQLPSADCSEVASLKCEEDLSPINDTEDAIGDLDMVSCPASPPISDTKPHDTDDLSTSPEEDEREINPSSMPEKAQCERNGSIENTKHAAKKSNGESSGDKFKPPFSGATKMSNGEGLGAKLKPIFCRGFLDKPPRKRFTMQDKESSVSVQHSQTSEVSIPHILPNGNHLKDEEKPCRDNGSHGEPVVSSSSQENGRS